MISCLDITRFVVKRIHENAFKSQLVAVLTLTKLDDVNVPQKIYRSSATCLIRKTCDIFHVYLITFLDMIYSLVNICNSVIFMLWTESSDDWIHSHHGSDTNGAGQ